MMASLSFVSNDDLASYLSYCWGVGLRNPDRPDTLYNISSYPQEYPGTLQVSQSMLDAVENVHDGILFALSEMRGFFIFAVIFGLSVAVSLVSLHYLVTRWKKTTSHLVVAIFTFFISALNCVIFGLRAGAILVDVTEIVCSEALLIQPRSAFLLEPRYSGSESQADSDNALSLSLIPLFLWMSDAFLLYRAWVIWIYHRKYTILPGLVFLASIISGIFWLVQQVPAGTGLAYSNVSSASFEDDITRWIPALAFSCSMDAITTGMIAGRLLYHHRKQKKMTGSKATFFLPIMTIFIESAALSLISKILQLSIPSLKNNPIVVPLCTISSNLIVLRKALGVDVSQAIGRGQPNLSALRFHRPAAQTTVTAVGSDPEGFEAQLIQSNGGHEVDIGPFNIPLTPVALKKSPKGTEESSSLSEGRISTIGIAV